MGHDRRRRHTGNFHGTLEISTIVAVAVTAIVAAIVAVRIGMRLMMMRRNHWTARLEHAFHGGGSNGNSGFFPRFGLTRAVASRTNCGN